MLGARVSLGAVGARARGAATRQSRLLSTLLVAEHDGATVSEATRAAVTACASLRPVTVLVAGESCGAAAEAAAALDGVDSVATLERGALAHGVAEEWTPAVLELTQSGGYSHVVAAASSFSRGFMPRVAALLDVAQVSDVTGVKDEKTFVRPIYAGNAVATVQSEDGVKVLTIRPTAFDKCAPTGGAAPIAAAEVGAAESGKARWVSDEVQKSDRPELTSAKAVISGGRGLKTGENFALLDGIATKLNAAVGASRAAVDSGMCPNDMQVGQTGKVVAPDLYIAVGISGAIQHLAGMKDSKVIVAINKDEEAPIFQVADFGLVADLFTAVPELIEKL